MPAARATSEATAPGSSAAATIRSFSEIGHRRRRCTDVITSTCVLVIGLSLGLILCLAIRPHFGNVAFTGRVRSMWLLLSISSPARCRMVDERCDDSATRHRCLGDGDLRRGKPDALLYHSDRGTQNTSEQFQKLMADH